MLQTVRAAYPRQNLDYEALEMIMLCSLTSAGIHGQQHQTGLSRSHSSSPTTVDKQPNVVVSQLRIEWKLMRTEDGMLFAQLELVVCIAC